MESNDGAEASELCGLYMINELTKKGSLFSKNQIGLYRDDGLAIVRTRSGRQLEQLKQRIFDIFRKEGLKITIEAGMEKTDFLDLLLDLSTGNHEPFRKENNNPIYINAKSNHPPKIIKELPRMIQKRLSTLSSNKEIFDRNKGPYEEALKNSGLQNELEFIPKEENKPKKRKRTRNPIYFTPPYSKNARGNLGANFLKLVDKHFPKGSKLHKYFNRSKIKISYSTMPNIKNQIGKHNAKILNNTKPVKKKKKRNNGRENCNCPEDEDCPLGEECLEKDIIYQADVICKDENNKNMDKKVYYGLTERTFKARYTEHKSSFKHEKENSTTLSTYVWSLKKRGLTPKIQWSIKARGHVISAGGRQCDLCLTEKLVIIRVVF